MPTKFSRAPHIFALALAATTLAATTAPARAQQPAQPQAQPAPTPPPAKPADVASIDAIVTALYDVISGPKGQARDWDRFRSLFVPNAKLIPTGPRQSGGFGHRFLTPDDYAQGSGSFLVEQGFIEKEIARRVEQYGTIAHVFSTYESYRLDEKQPFMRGINSIQLFNDGTRWYVVNIFWSPETPQNPLPAKYLTSPTGS